MFGFGKALDILDYGDPVRRHDWPPDQFLIRSDLVVTEIVAQTPLGRALKGFVTERAMYHASLQLVRILDERPHVYAWAPSDQDLLASDWEVPAP